MPDSLVGYRDVEPPSADPQAQREYAALVQGLAERSDWSLRDDKPSVALRLDADAARAFLSVRRDIELRLRPGGDLAQVGEWAGKAAGPRGPRVPASPAAGAAPPGGMVEPGLRGTSTGSGVGRLSRLSMP
jgi:hypothetical protein